MKRWIALILTVLLVCCSAACSPETPADTPTLVAETAVPDKTITVTDDMRTQLDESLQNNKFRGVLTVTQGGEIIYRYINGNAADGEPFALDSTMLIGSVSKQFCAACILILRDAGKLSVDDTLDKYFPDYEQGSKLTIKHLLTMRSGIPNFWDGLDLRGLGEDAEANIAYVKNWALSRPLDFEPDSDYAYSNTNFFLLSLIVEQVSGQDYHHFVRENIFEPLQMEHSGFLEETFSAPEWVKGIPADAEYDESGSPGLSRGAGDIATTAPDMEKWMAGLSGGMLISKDSYREMTADYSPDGGKHYGYGIEQMYRDGVGHPGTIATYNAIDYINAEYDLHLFAASNRSSAQAFIERLPQELMTILIEEE